MIKDRKGNKFWQIVVKVHCFLIKKIINNLKKPKDLLYKYKNLCEYKDNYVFFNRIDENFLDERVIEENIRNQKDIIGRSDIFKKEKIDNSYPDYILNNILTFKDWII